MEKEINIHEEIRKINERNARVTADKAWETSASRRISIMALTYLVVSCSLLIAEAPHPLLSAIVPPIGYLLSTLTLPAVKVYWMKNVYGKE